MAVAGGPISDALALKAVYQAGYEGQLFATSGTAYLTLTQLLPPEVLEGFLNGAWAVEFDPPIGEEAAEFKNAWIARYGKYEGLDLAGVCQYCCLMAALEQADSLDVDEVAAVLSNGMTYATPGGTGQMISRPDYGNERTVDSITTYYVKRVENGQPVLVDTIEMDEALKYFRMAYSTGEQ
jgi:ABC-type branched-subunit amino acid transport system substrate-binding protein